MGFSEKRFDYLEIASQICHKAGILIVICALHNEILKESRVGAVRLQEGSKYLII